MTNFLNVFRGLAAFYVVLGHCLLWSATASIYPTLAVDLFMVISGFLMCLTMKRDRSPSRFYIRRFFRIAPAYYAALLATFLLQKPMRDGVAGFANPALAWFQTPPIDITSVALHFSFIFGLVPAYSDSTMLPDWSLSLEMQFYAVFPLLFALAGHRRWFPLIALGLTLGSIGLTAAIARVVPFPAPSPLVFKLPMFLLGMLIYYRRLVVPALIVVAVIEWRAWGLAGFGVIPVMGALAWLWTHEKDIPEHPLIAWGSELSYGVYLCHIPVLMLIGPAILHEYGAAAMTIAVIAIAYLVAAILHFSVEKPGIAFGKWIASPNVSARPAPRPEPLR